MRNVRQEKEDVSLKQTELLSKMLFELGDWWCRRTRLNWKMTGHPGEWRHWLTLFCILLLRLVQHQWAEDNFQDLWLSTKRCTGLPCLITACEKLAWTCYSKEGWAVSFPFLWQDTDAQLQLSYLLWSTGLAHCYPVLEHFGFYTLN